MTVEFEEQFEQFWESVSDGLYRYMLCGCRCRSEAEDLVQDCMARAVRGWAGFDGKSTRKNWLFSIARRTLADWFRRERRTARTRQLYMHRISESSTCSSNDVMPEKSELIWSVVSRLSDKQAEIIRLRFAVGLSYQQMSQLLNVPPGTVRSRLHRALITIRQFISEQENET